VRPIIRSATTTRTDPQSRLGAEAILLGGLLLATCALILASSFVGDVVFLHRVLSLILLAAAMVYGVRLWFRQPGAVNLWSIFLLSSIVAFAGAGIVGPDDTTRSNAYAFRSMQALVLVVVGLVGSRVGFCLVRTADVGAQEKVAVCLRVRQMPMTVIIGELVATWALRGYLAAAGLVLSWTPIDVLREAWLSQLVQLSSLLRSMTVFVGAALITDERNGRRRLGAAILAGELAYALLMGRRLLVEVVVIVVMVGLWFGRGMRLSQAASRVAAIGVVLFIAWPFVFHVRQVAREVGLYGAETAARPRILLSEVMPRAVATFDPLAMLEPGGPYVENVRERVHHLDFLVDIQTAHQDGRGFLWGRGLVTSLVAVIPRFAWPGKTHFMESGESLKLVEQLIQAHFSLPLVDSPSTVLTDGYADGGAVGILAYMILMGLAFAMFERWVGRCRSSASGLWIYAIGASLAVGVEGEITDLFALGRVIVVILIGDRLCGGAVERWMFGRLRPNAWSASAAKPVTDAVGGPAGARSSRADVA